MTVINKFSNVPLYCQLKKIIQEKIESGEFKENDKIPSEQEFCEAYGISRPTVRQAINELTSNGYLYKLKGKGTFVSKQKASIHIKDYSGFTDSILDCDEPGNKTIVSMNIIKPDSYKKLIDIFGVSKDSGEEFAEITYLKTDNDEIISLNSSYISIQYFPDICEDINNKRSSYEILRDKYPLVPYRSKSVLEIIYTNQIEAGYLQVQPGQALIKINNILFSKSGQVVEYVITKYRADKCKLLFENIK